MKYVGIDEMATFKQMFSKICVDDMNLIHLTEDTRSLDSLCQQDRAFSSTKQSRCFLNLLPQNREIYHDKLKIMRVFQTFFLNSLMYIRCIYVYTFVNYVIQNCSNNLTNSTLSISMKVHFKEFLPNYVQSISYP